MKEYYLVEINSIKDVRISSILLDRKILCPIIAVKNDNNNYLEDIITGEFIYPNLSNNAELLTYSKITLVDNDMLLKYFKVIKGLNEENIKEYFDYFDMIYNYLESQKELYKEYMTKMNHIENHFAVERYIKKKYPENEIRTYEYL